MLNERMVVTFVARAKPLPKDVMAGLAFTGHMFHVNCAPVMVLGTIPAPSNVGRADSVAVPQNPQGGSVPQ